MERQKNKLPRGRSTTETLLKLSDLFYLLEIFVVYSVEYVIMIYGSAPVLHNEVNIKS